MLLVQNDSNKSRINLQALIHGNKSIISRRKEVCQRKNHPTKLEMHLPAEPGGHKTTPDDPLSLNTIPSAQLYGPLMSLQPELSYGCKIQESRSLSQAQFAQKLLSSEMSTVLRVCSAGMAPRV